MNWALDLTIKEIGINNEIIFREISGGTEEVTQITKEEYDELLRNGMPKDDTPKDDGIDTSIAFFINFF